MATIAAAGGLDLTTEMFFYMEVFGWAGYVAMIILFFTAIIELMSQWKQDKTEERTG